MKHFYIWLKNTNFFIKLKNLKIKNKGVKYGESQPNPTAIVIMQGKDMREFSILCAGINRRLLCSGGLSLNRLVRWLSILCTTWQENPEKQGAF